MHIGTEIFCHHKNKELFSGEDFYKDVGYLEAATDVYGNLEGFESSRNRLIENGFVCQKETGKSLSNILPCLNLPEKSRVHYQPASNKK